MKNKSIQPAKIAFFTFVGILGAIIVTAMVMGMFQAGEESGDMDTEPPATASAAPVSPPSAGADVVRDVKSELGTDVEWTSDIVQTEPGRVEIYTNMTDDGPTGADTMKAVALCEGAARTGGVTYAAVYESDGTVWTVYGHPAHPDGCTII